MPVGYTGQRLDNLALATTVKTSETSVTATSSAAADTCMTIGPFFVEGGNYFVVIFTPYLTKGTTNLDVELWVDGAFSQALSGHMAASVAVPGVTLYARVALGNGNHTLLVKGFVDAGTGKFGANNGATGNPPNALGFVIP